jgi:hypothetical protein
MQRRSMGNSSGDDANKRNFDETERNHQLGRRKRRRVAEVIESLATPEEPADGSDAHSTLKSSISVLLDQASSPASVLKATSDIKDIIDACPSNRSLVVDSGCIPPLLQRLGTGFDDHDEHILQVISALCKENQVVRQQFRTLPFIKKAVALAIPALGDLASSSPASTLARAILKALSNGTGNYDNDVLSEQQQRLDSLKAGFLMSQTLSSASTESCHGGNCSICLENLDHDSAAGPPMPDSSVACLPCKHYFHKPCISKWFSKHASCPVCRHKLQEPPRTPPILSPTLSLPFPLSLILGLGAFGGAGISFGLPASPSRGGMNIVVVSFRSGNAQPSDLSPSVFFE